MKRCCASHADWPTLGSHLVRDFRDVEATVVVRELGAAKAAATGLGLPMADALQMSELIARHQLMMLTGQVSDGVRLDPESHSARSQLARAIT